MLKSSSMNHKVNLVVIFIFFSAFFEYPASQLYKQNSGEVVCIQRDSCEENDLLREFVTFDFSELFLPKTKFLGYIGSDFKRIFIEYTSIKKDSCSDTTYKIIGKSSVSGNSCDFAGLIELSSIDKRYKGRNKEIERYTLTATYHFEEDSAQSFSGVFRGNCKLFFYKKNCKLYLDDIDFYSDTYCNNQYEGVWSSYRKNTLKKCNWGEYRIPDSGDLDIGAGEFSVNPKYYSRGWR